MITCKEPIIRSLVKKNIIFSSYLQTLGKEKVKETYPSLALLSINALALQPTTFCQGRTVSPLFLFCFASHISQEATQKKMAEPCV